MKGVHHGLSAPKSPRSQLAFDHEGWTYGFDASTGTLDAGFDLDCRIGQTPLYIHLLEDVVLCHAYAPFKVAEEDRRRVMEFVTRANCGLKLGNFEMDLDAASSASRRPSA